ADRPSRADQPASSDTFATLLGAHADRPERTPSRRERQPADDQNAPRERDHDRVDRSRSAPADAQHAPAKPTAPADGHATDATKTATSDDAAKAALLALGVPAPQPTTAPATPAPVTATAQPTPVATPQP